MGPSGKNTSLIAVRLYRNLLRAARPYTAPARDARLMNCLLHRTGIDDHITDWPQYVSSGHERTPERARDLSASYFDESDGSEGEASKSIPPNLTHQRLFRRLLREVVCSGDVTGIRKTSWPSMVDPTILHQVIRREFRGEGELCASRNFDPKVRRQVAFTALRELNKKLSYWDQLQRKAPKYNPLQAAHNVSRLPFLPSTSYLQPGSFLLAHPHMGDSFFSKTVICLLDHKNEGEGDDIVSTFPEQSAESAQKRQSLVPGQTYGLIVNRVSLEPHTGKLRNLNDVFDQNSIPKSMADVFGESLVREGGPVHASLQMVHAQPKHEKESLDTGASSTSDAVESATSTEETPKQKNNIGGRVIPMIPKNEESSTALYSDEATMYDGDVFHAVAAVSEGRLDKDNVSFFVGASTWAEGQLRDEVTQGFWIPCRAPPEIARTGRCSHRTIVDSDDDDDEVDHEKPLADLWLSMMSACGEEESKLAHLFYNEEDLDGNGLACDAYDDEEIDFF